MELFETKAGNCGIEDEPCPFCEQEKTFRFNEHYHFCPNCSCIYYRMILIKGCNHINEKNKVIVERPPWFRESRDTIAYVFNSMKGQFCSFCKQEVILDGF